MTTVTAYTQQLIFALRLRDIPGDVIGDAVAQVESHVADTGEDPVTAFGPAREYAATFGPRTPLARRWSWYVTNGALGALFGVILAIGIAGQIRDEPLAWGVSPWAAIALGVLGILGYFIAATVFWADRIKDPRKSREAGRSDIRHDRPQGRSRPRG
ncbi:hypothetical protein J2Y69_002322 [Microbacterium resistens]|uniref:Uncharacterized protein n=1 Tax=Microbacterium resistens TaxID=156977 RepID=A0ABU1SDN3_9MICO|nr:hypothetical protein [Microbacterium resistens]MDR6867718.1 hypothetical protein [Microbacterium resistens]